MKKALAFLLAVTPMAVSAQQASQASPTMNMPNWSAFQTAADSYGMQPSEDSPAVARDKLARAIALRDEANTLRIADGGTLSDAHLRYIQRKANAIRAGR